MVIRIREAEASDEGVWRRLWAGYLAHLGAAVPEDELGNGYEYLIKKFADDSGHTAQEFYT